MKLEVSRFYANKDITLGLLFIDGEFECFTLEDERREVKVWGETRIPEGEYKIKYRKVGGFHERYSTRFGNSHKGMLHLQDVPEFDYVLIHIGNTEDDTAGCLLVGDIADKSGVIGYSKRAYTNMYSKVSKALDAGEEVSIKITNKQ